MNMMMNWNELGLDHSTGRLCGLLLQRRVFFPAERSHERQQSRHRPDAGAPHESVQSAQAVLRPHQTLVHLRPLLRRQFQRHSQEVPQHGRQIVRMSLIYSSLFF